MRDNNSTLAIGSKDFEHITSAIPIVKITQRYENKSLCGQLAEKNLEILRDNNSTLEIEKKDFENDTSACPKSHKVVWVNIFVANFQKNLETLKDNKFNNWNWEILNMFHQQCLKSHEDMWVNIFVAN